MTDEPTFPPHHEWNEHKFIKYMASDFGLVVDRDDYDYVLYSRCICGATPLDALLAARIVNLRPAEVADGN